MSFTNQMTKSFSMLAVVSALSLSLAMNAYAETYPEWADTAEEQKGYDIAKTADNSDNGFGNSVVSAQMILRNAAGQETTRDLNFSTLEREDNSVGDKSLVVFKTPRDVEGTALLSHAQILKADNQWLFLPALKRVKRISSANKSGPFVGSEFAFEDFTSLELNKYTYKYLETSTLDLDGESLQVDVVERIPAYKKSGYSRQIAYIDTEHNQLRKVEFFDRRGAKLKDLELTGYRLYSDNIWRAHKLSMSNTVSKKTTDLVYSEYQFDQGLTDRDFVKGVLETLD
ncbi:outer membrane lipoprotein-sorting protein [Hirschia maritima]|uniref:outer membrane lipoprotein-sorting protein n=1 Tax=Hirschia maritima TaxID=1121961 RepID=UPI00035C3541|nr:outer membrane lipoprotein-sorting protein [Hirschia maritima]